MSKTLEFIDNKTLKKLRDMGLIKEGALQAYKIRKDWRMLKIKHGSYKAIDILAEKYNLSFERIRNIVYEKK